MLSILFPVWILSAKIASAYPADAVSNHPSPHVFERNPCDGKDAEPILYHDYKNDLCPPPMGFESPGVCHMKKQENDGLWWNPFRGFHCGGFCEENVGVQDKGLIAADQGQQVRFFYGQESMFLSNPYCHGPMTCGITDTTTTAWAYTINFPLSGKIADFSGGVTGGVSNTNTVARAVNKAVKLEHNECGYFTWIPILRESW